MPPKIIGQGRESLTRKEIVKRMQEEHLQDLGLPNKIVSRIINAFLEVYKESILDSNRVEIRGFGVMKSELIRSRIIQHPETREKIPAEAHYRLAFIPAQSFRDSLKARAKQEALKK